LSLRKNRNKFYLIAKLNYWSKTSGRNERGACRQADVLARSILPLATHRIITAAQKQLNLVTNDAEA